MATLADLNVVIACSIDDFEKKMKSVQDGIGRLGDAAKSAGQTLSTYVTLPLGLLAGAALTASGKIDALRRGLQAVTQQQLGEQGITGLVGIQRAAEDTRARLVELRQVAALPGLGFAEAVQGDIRLRAVGISADLSKRALLAFGNAIATTGGSKSELDRVTVQLGQLSAKGKVLAQDLRPIIEAAPAVATALKKLYGTVDSETISKSLAKQGKSSTDFIGVLTDELAKLPKVTGGLKNAFENLQDSGEIALAKLGDSLNKAFNVEGNIGALGDYISNLADRFDQLSPAAQKALFVVAGVAAAVGPVLVVLGTIGAATPAIAAGIATLSTGFAGLGGALAGLISPVGLVVVGLAALAAGAYYLATANERALATYQEQAKATKAQADELNPLLARYDELRAQTSLNVAEQEELRAIIQRVTDVLPEAGKGLDSYGKFLDINAEKARDAMKANEGLSRALAVASLPAAEAELKRLQNRYDAITKMRAEFNRSGKLSASEGPGGARTSFVPDAAQIASFINGINLINADLEKQKGIVADLRGAINGYAEALVTVETLSEGRGKAGGLSQAQLDALEKLRKHLLDNDNASRALGSAYDYLGNRQKILESGVKSLTDVGFAPAGRTVQGFAKEVRSLNILLNATYTLLATSIPRGLAALGDGTKDGLGNLKKFNPLDGSEIKPLLPPQTLPTIDYSYFTVPMEEAYAKVTEVQRAAVQRLTDFNTSAGMALEQMNQIIRDGLASAASSMIQGIVQVVDGARPIDDLGGILLGAVGAMLIQLGELAIATGITMDAIKKAFNNPYTAIIAGAAAIAVGAAASSAAQGILSGGGRGGSTPAGALGGSGSGGSFNSAYSQQQAPPLRIIVTGELTGRGDALKGIVRSADYRRSRTN